MEKDFMKRIVVNPRVMVGKPVIKGTRVTIDAILGRIAEGWTFDDILEDFPHITKADIKAAIMYAESIVRGEDIMPEIDKHAIHS
ncbi:DUF433 domain-containing protein [Candidatus Woesearchaeota archaeon]|nr:DUF433 domain-containing protein [Candidatus Woesearchaeota archaeon]